jgi:IS1 family transposase
VADNQGDRWTFAAVLPNSGFVHTTHTGPRTQEEAAVFVEKIKAKSDQKAPFFMSDCWFYAKVLLAIYCIWVAVEYCGRGRPPGPKQAVDPALRYAQVHKKRNSKGKIESISTRIVIGDEVEILNELLDAERSKTINTDYVESRNGKFRKDNARLIRKTLCHSKAAKYHDASIQFLTQVFNYTRCVVGLRVEINPNAVRFEQKYQNRTPAMAEGLIHKPLTIKQLLCIRPIIIIP